jgi:predicted RNase H-like nuclease
MAMTRPGSQRGAHLPYRTLAGVVPCPRGWLVASAKLQGITLAPEGPTVLSSFVEVLDYKPAFQVIALFSPVGLSDEPVAAGRACDREARALLRWPRSGAILSAPTRRCLRCTSYSEAAEANGGRLSVVGWRMMAKIAEVHEQMAPYWQRTVFEVHPELSFFQLNDEHPVRYSKHSQAGRQERRALMESRMPGVQRILDDPPSGVNDAHLLDAAACLWTARRIVSRGVVHLPESPTWDSEGLRMEIVW